MRSLFVLIVCFVAASGANAEQITISRVVPFSENSGARDEIKQKCMLETQIPQHIKLAAKGKLDVVVTTDDLETVAGKILVVEITGVDAPRGGGFARGGQSMLVHAELRENGVVLASKDRRRRTAQGFSTCGSLNRVSNALGQDIVGWLQQIVAEDQVVADDRASRNEFVNQ
jgi:hypothetical protein